MELRNMGKRLVADRTVGITRYLSYKTGITIPFAAA